SKARSGPGSAPRSGSTESGPPAPRAQEAWAPEPDAGASDTEGWAPEPPPEDDYASPAPDSSRPDSPQPDSSRPGSSRAVSSSPAAPPPATASTSAAAPARPASAALPERERRGEAL